MSFLYPFFLLLLPLSIIPLILFLGTRGRKREILFSTLFLLRSKEFKEERIKQKFRLWLLIVIRILMLVTLILLLSRPRFFGKRWGKVYFDASFSMRYDLKRHYSYLKRFFTLFGERRVVVLNTFKNRLFVLDTTSLPLADKNDIFFTDGKVPYLPDCNIICSGKDTTDSWLYVEGAENGKVIIRVKTSRPSWIYVYNSTGAIDSLSVKPGINRISYNGLKNADWYVFNLTPDDDFPYNNVFYYIPYTASIPVRLMVKSIPLKAFFSTIPFSISDTSRYCVGRDKFPANCEKAVIFSRKGSKIWDEYAKETDSTFFIGRVQSVLVKSGIKSYLIIDATPQDTSWVFFDPFFIKAFSEYLKGFFEVHENSRNLHIRDIKGRDCKKVQGEYRLQGIFVCNGKKVAVNPDPYEYTLPSICEENSIKFDKIARSIMLPEKLLVYFLVLLFVLETLLVYVI